MPNSILANLQQASVDQRPHILGDFIRQQLFDFLELDSLDEVAGDVDFASLGADSIQAVDFKSELESHLNCSLRTTLLFDYPRLDLLIAHLLNDSLSFESVVEKLLINNEDQTKKLITSAKIHPHEEKSNEIAIIAMAGVFPSVENVDSFWAKVQEGAFLDLASQNNNQIFKFGQIGDIDLTDDLKTLGLSIDQSSTMGHQQKLMFKVIAKAMQDYSLSLKDLSGKKTGVFVGAKVGIDDAEHETPTKIAYRIPIPNEISFHLDLKGPSEVFNTFCTSVYVALHRAIQSIVSGECEQAIVGGVNTISKNGFVEAAEAGLYNELLSKDNKTLSFSDDANGYTRSEGAGVIIIKRVTQAHLDNNRVLAVVKGTAVYHGGKGYSVEAPNAQGMKEAIKQSLTKADISTESIDYIEAHGIGNVLADAVELGAIDTAYRQLSNQKDKQWYISTVKPTIGHPEISAGIASLIKVIKAFEYETIPGLASLGKINTEIGLEHSLVLQKDNHPWVQTYYPRRAALNSFAIGGVNAHVILEQPGINLIDHSANKETYAVDAIKTDLIASKNGLNQETESLIHSLFYDAFAIDFSEIDKSRSIVEYGFDSINVIHFVTRVNETLDINIKIGQVLSVDTIADFSSLIQKEIERKTNLGSENEEQKLLVFSALREIPTQFSQSEVQKGLWYIQQALPHSTSFNVPLTFKVKKSINSGFLEQALTLMFKEHPVLTANFVQDADSEEIIQVLSPAKKGQITDHLSINSNEDLNQTLIELLRKPFNLESDLLVCLYAVNNTNNGDIYVYFVIHHIIFDGISGALFIASFWEKYHQLLAGKTIVEKTADIAFFDYINWEKNYLDSVSAQQDLAWWKEQLEGKSPTVNLPYDKIPQPGEINLGVGCEHFTIDKEFFKDLKDLTVTLKVNFSVLLLATFNMFLHKLCQETDIVVSSPVLGRPKQAFEESIGCYINLMVTRTQVLHDKTFTSLLSETKEKFIGGIDHAYYPFSKLMPELGLTLTNPNEVPFPISYTYQNIFDNLLNNPDALGDIEPLFEVYQEIEDNYTLEVYDLRDSLKINLKYKRNLFEKETVQRHLAYFTTLLKEVINDSNKEINDYDMLPSSEKSQLLKTFNESAFNYPKDKSITALFEAQAHRTPDAVAVVFDNQEITYQTLDERSKQLAIYLQQQSVSADTLVAVCMNRSIDMIVAIFGILRSGGAYLPIDPNNAADRINYMLEDGNVSLLLTQTVLHQKLSEQTINKHCRLISIDDKWEDDGGGVQEPIINDVFKPQNLAYIIYTSGSTGQPKGVMLTQQSLVNLSYAMVEQYKITNKDRVIQFASLSFDMSVEEIFPHLISGAAVVIRQEKDIQAENFYQLVMENAVSIINVPPLFYNVIELLSSDQKELLFNQLRLVAFGGEALPDTVLKSAQAYDIEIFNAYGPTECTVNAAIADLSKSKKLTIGRPILNTQLYVLGSQLNLLPIGVSGELHIAGDGLARGYLNLPRLTDEKFINNPFAEGKLYKTGDIVRWTVDGDIEYIGRADDQVKIRGYRVELGEVESVLAHYEHIESAVVIAQPHSQGNKLIAYYAAENNVEESLVDGNALRSYFRKHLPDYMVPSLFIQLDKMPITSNGKADRQDLQTRDVDFSSTEAYVAPTSKLEISLVDIWQEVLEIDKVGIEDDFFALGGHSLIAVQIILKINKEFAVDIPLSTIFEAANIKNLAEVIAHSDRVSSEDTLETFEAESVEWII